MSTINGIQMSDFGRRLREERERLGLNQTELGDLADVKKNAQSNYEQGLRYPSADYLQRLAQAGADVLYILTGQRTTGVLSPDEAALLAAFRAMDARGRAAALAMAAGYTQPAGTSFQIGGSVGQLVQGNATFHAGVKFDAPPTKPPRRPPDAKK